jgi:HEAT repeat protein
MNEGDTQLKREATVALGRIGSPEAVRALKAALTGADALVRVVAAHALEAHRGIGS